MVVGSQELREGALVPAGLDPTVLQMEPIMYCVLEAVAQFRQFGVFRPQLTQSFLKGKDARKAWHIIKRLARMQLVVVKVWLVVVKVWLVVVKVWLVVVKVGLFV